MAEINLEGVSQRSPITIKDQPLEERLKFGSGLHQKLISRLIARRRMSERAMTRRYDSWNRVDENCRLFIDLSRGVKYADGTSSQDKKEIPWARSIVVPMSYAILQVYLTQLMGIFTRRDPPLEIQGVGAEDVRPAKLMNAVIAYDQVQTNYILELYTALQDALKYGLGGFHDYWDESFGYKTERAEGLTAKILEMRGLSTSRRVWQKLKQFNRVEAWDPFNFFPDPRVSLSNIQRGEFCGTRYWLGYLELLSGSIDNGGNYFNLDEIPKSSPKTQQLRSRNRFQASQMNIIGSSDEKDKGFHAIDSYIVELIPNEWELGPEDRPEKWHFAWSDDTVIIRAHRADYDHGEINYSVLESNIDTHVFGNQGSIENMDGLQRFMCYSEDTEILTERGWSRFQDLAEADKVATVSADGERRLSFEKPNGFAAYDYDGEMVHLGGSDRGRFDLLVTPNHRMWIQKRMAKTKRTMVDGNTVRVCEDRWWTDGEFSMADKMRPWLRIPNSVSWDGGADAGYLALPAKRSPLGRPGRPYDYPEMLIPYDVLAPFIGWYVSEGSATDGYVCLGQKNRKFIPVLDELLTKKFPKKFNRTVEPNGTVRWNIHDWRLADWLRENCGHGTANKKVPDIAQGFSARLSKALLNAAVCGDGHRHRENLATYTSTSANLVDGLQIVALRAGFEASISKVVKRGKRSQAYCLNLVESGESRQIGKVGRVQYQGKVYCVENSTHLLVVRRNGHVAVCGNTWKYNSHVQNIIRHLNNRMVYASSLIEAFDVENPDAGMHIRLTALGEQMVKEGRMTIPQMIHQLDLQDVTSSMMKDIAFDMDLVMRMSGAADSMMGQTTRDKRTLGEVTRVGHEGSARMAMHAIMMDIQGIRPTVLRWVANRQQYTDQDQYVRIAGDMVEEFGSDRVKVKPQDIQGNFDYIPKTGPEPGDPAEIAGVLRDGLTAIISNPEILALPDKNNKMLDPHEIIKEILRNSNIKNVNDYYRSIGGQPGQQPPAPNVRVLPDEQVQKMQQAGNLVGIQGGRAA